MAGRHLRHLKAISTDNGRVTTAFLAAATRLEVRAAASRCRHASRLQIGIAQHNPGAWRTQRLLLLCRDATRRLPPKVSSRCSPPDSRQSTQPPITDRATSCWLQALELDFWGHSNAVPRGITAAARLTSLKLQCSSGLGRTSALGALSALRELVVIDGDWQALPPEVVRLPLTRLHLRFADLEAPDWLAALTGGGTQATTAGSNGRASSDGGGTGAAAPEATITVNGAPAPAATITATLEELTLEGCQLRAIPEGLAELTALTSLTLDRNYLTQGSLPDAMSRLCRLRRLSLEACPSLVALPPGLAGLKLEYLNLLQTGVQALPEGAACLAHLTQLSWGMAAAEPVRLGLSALLCAGRLRVLRLDNVSREQDADLPALRQRLAALDYLRINSALLLG